MASPKVPPGTKSPRVPSSPRRPQPSSPRRPQPSSSSASSSSSPRRSQPSSPRRSQPSSSSTHPAPSSSSSSSSSSFRAGQPPSPRRKQPSLWAPLSAQRPVLRPPLTHQGGPSGKSSTPTALGGTPHGSGPWRRLRHGPSTGMPPWALPCVLGSLLLGSLAVALFALAHMPLSFLPPLPSPWGPPSAYFCSFRWHAILREHLPQQSTQGASLLPPTNTASSSASGDTSGSAGATQGEQPEGAPGYAGGRFATVGAERLCGGGSIREALLEASAQGQEVGGLAFPRHLDRDTEAADCTSQEMGTSTPGVQLREYRGRQFLWVASVPEQLTKARQHLAEAVTLARLANRTLVLPRVGDSHVGAARLLPFCVYFDADRLAEYVPWVTEDFFLRVVRATRWRLRSRFLCILPPGGPRCADSLGPYSTPALLLSLLAITQTSFLDPRSFVEVHSGYHTARDRDVAAMAREDGELRRTVGSLGAFHLLAFLQSGGYFFTLNLTARAEGLAAVRYAPYLQREADRFASQLGDGSVCLHLRLEWQIKQALKTAAVGDALEGPVMYCAAQAQEAAQKLRGGGKGGGSRVFLASDVTLRPRGQKGGKGGGGGEVVLETDSFKYNASESRVLLAHLSRALGLIHTRLSPMTWEARDPGHAARDRGVKSTLDKLLCARAAVFLQAHKFCGGGQSFDREIEDIRAGLGKNESSIARFGAAPKPPPASRQQAAGDAKPGQAKVLPPPLAPKQPRNPKNEKPGKPKR